MEGWGKLIGYLMEVCNEGLNGDVPKEWVDCKIVLVHKKDTTNDPNYYQGIALLLSEREDLQKDPRKVNTPTLCSSCGA